MLNKATSPINDQNDITQIIKGNKESNHNFHKQNYTPHAHIYRTPTLKYINTHPKPPHHLIPDTHLTFINMPRASEARLASDPQFNGGAITPGATLV